MAASQHTSGRILAHDLAAYTDAELDQYLDEHTTEGGPTVVDVADPENLSSDFIQRLRDRAERASIATHSRAVGLDQVTARLLQATSSRFASPPPQSPASDGGESFATLPASPPVNHERRCHAMLVNDGGRPLYPISLLDDVSQDPGAYKEMLRPWLDAPDQDSPDWDRVFEKQAYSWRDFRLWQAYNRNQSSADITAQPCVTVYRFFSRHFRHKSPSYTEALGSLLAQYGFTRPFQLQDHAADQDALTTWIEYLGFVCADHYRSAQFVQRGQPEQDEAWKALVDSGVLRPCEPREYFDDISSAYRMDAEEDRALQGVQMAELAVAAALEKESKPPNGSRQEHALELDTSRFRLDVALKQLESVQRRNGLIIKFKSGARNHDLAREAARRHYARLHWILDQMPLVEAEMREAQAAEGNSISPSRNSNGGGEPGFQSRRKRPREQSEDQPAKPPTAASVSPPVQTGSAYQCTRLDNSESGPLRGRSKRLRKDVDGAIAETTTPRGRPTTSKPTRSRQPDATPQTPMSPTRDSKQRTRSFAASDSGVAPRRSRPLTRDQPEFGLLKERREVTPVKEPVQLSSESRHQVQAPPADVPKFGGTTVSKQAPTAPKKRRAR